jgi:hypothetical protein
MKRERVWWAAGFVVGLVLGMAMSLVYAWVLDPPPRSLATAATLNPQDREVYTVLVAAAYAVDGNLERAKHRLAAFGDADVGGMVVAMAERFIVLHRDVRDVQALARLADALGRTSAAVRPFIATPTPTLTPTPTSTHTPTAVPTSTRTPTQTRTPTITLTPTRTATPRDTSTPAPAPTPTRTPTPTVEMDRYRLLQSTAVCDRRADGLLRIYVRDAQGNGTPGVQLLVNWPGGSDTFYTGFKPDVDPGYADFQMQPGEVYQVELANAKGDMAQDVGKNLDTACPELSANAQPSWQIVFQLPGR